MDRNIPLLAPDEGQVDVIRRGAPEGVEVIWVDSTQPLEQQAAQLRDAVALLAVPSEFPVELARACPNLKLVSVASAGTDRIDLQALGELGIRVANCGGANAIAVLEHTIGLMVNVFRRFQFQIQAAKSRRWQRDLVVDPLFQSHELDGKTVGIIGLGHIGQQVAKRLQGWECTLIYHDEINHPPELEEELHVTRVSIGELLRTSDVVTLHLPLTRSTIGMMGDREFEMMKPTAVLINTCRGPVVDEAALVRALREGKIVAAGLDVLEEEPTPADNPLLGMDNVVVTPHLAGFTQEAHEKSRAFAVQNAARFISGQEPLSVVLPE